MTADKADKQENEKDKPQPEHGPEVAISVNGQTREIHRGHRSVAEIKTIGGVPLADDLEQVVNGKLVPLPDDGHVTLKGGEEFISHPKDSSSS